MTKQEIFNTVCEHLVQQGGRSTVPNSSGYMQCAYRGEDGRKCAAGVLLKDEHFHPAFNSSAIYGDYDPTIHTGAGYEAEAALHASGVPLDAFDLVHDLQLTHDAMSNWNPAYGGITASLRALARRHDLEQPECIREVSGG